MRGCDELARDFVEFLNYYQFNNLKISFLKIKFRRKSKVLFIMLHIIGLMVSTVLSGKSGFLAYDDYAGSPYSVKYDNRSLIVGGDRG